MTLSPHHRAPFLAGRVPQRTAFIDVSERDPTAPPKLIVIHTGLSPFLPAPPKGDEPPKTTHFHTGLSPFVTAPRVPPAEGFGEEVGTPKRR